MVGESFLSFFFWELASVLFLDGWIFDWVELVVRHLVK